MYSRTKAQVTLNLGHSDPLRWSQTGSTERISRIVKRISRLVHDPVAHESLFSATSQQPRAISLSPANARGIPTLQPAKTKPLVNPFRRVATAAEPLPRRSSAMPTAPAKPQPSQQHRSKQGRHQAWAARAEQMASGGVDEVDKVCPCAADPLRGPRPPHRDL